MYQTGDTIKTTIEQVPFLRCRGLAGKYSSDCSA